MSTHDETASPDPDAPEGHGEDTAEETLDEPGTTDDEGMPVDNPSGG